MPKRSRREPDANQLASSILERATGTLVAPAETAKKRVKNPAAVKLGRLGGKKGGVARAKKLTKDERSAIARKAALARWADRAR